VETVEPIATAQVDVCSLALKQLHHWQLLTKNRVMQGCKATLVSLVDQLSLALVVEGRRLSLGAFFVVCKDELNCIDVAVVGRSMQEGASGWVNQLMDISKILLQEPYSVFSLLSELYSFEYPPQHTN
jgi:hypothetical protein